MRWLEILLEINYLPPNKLAYVIDRHCRWLDSIRGKHPRGGGQGRAAAESRKLVSTARQLDNLEKLMKKTNDPNWNAWGV